MKAETLKRFTKIYGEFNPQPSVESEVISSTAYENENSPETFFVVTREKNNGEIFEVYETEKRLNIGEKVKVVPMVNRHQASGGSIIFYDIK